MTDLAHFYQQYASSPDGRVPYGERPPFVKPLPLCCRPDQHSNSNEPCTL
ncbi:MAG: hypothetical protein AAGG51_09185 [Cyanobacteria bacterium P01_G01_bin.54]